MNCRTHFERGRHESSKSAAEQGCCVSAGAAVLCVHGHQHFSCGAPVCGGSTCPVALLQVRLLQQTADDDKHFEPGSFDVVILNSVVQYFPSANYLVRVVEAACRALSPDGSIFVGDVRSFALLEALHTSLGSPSAGLTLRRSCASECGEHGAGAGNHHRSRVLQRASPEAAAVHSG